jgi:hypothetical protein
LTNQGREFLGEEFQILCRQHLIDYQTTSQDHMKMNRLGKKVVQMVKWGSQTYGLQKGHLKYWNLQLPWLAIGYQFKQTSLPSFSPFFFVLPQGGFTYNNSTRHHYNIRP